MNFSTKVDREQEIVPAFSTQIFSPYEDEPTQEEKLVSLFEYQIKLYDYVVDRKRSANTKYKLRAEISRIEAEILDRIKRMTYV